MDFASDHMIARVLLTLLIVGNTLIPPLVDFNRTHATNPLWTPHARFHVVWQMTSYLLLGLLSLGLLWAGGPTATLRLWIVVLILAALNIGFVTALAARPIYGGTVADTNGVPPIGRLNLGGRTVVLDANVTFFSGFLVLLAVSALFAL